MQLKYRPSCNGSKKHSTVKSGYQTTFLHIPPECCFTFAPCRNPIFLVLTQAREKLGRMSLILLSFYCPLLARLLLYL